MPTRSDGVKSNLMNSFIVMAVSECSDSSTQRKAEVLNQITRSKHYILFKEHDADSGQISAVFTDEEYSRILSATILKALNGHTYKSIQANDILKVVL